MRQITLTLTEDQANQLEYVLSYYTGWVQDNTLPKTAPQNAFYERIKQKIRKSLAQAKISDLS